MKKKGAKYLSLILGESRALWGLMTKVKLSRYKQEWGIVHDIQEEYAHLIFLCPTLIGLHKVFRRVTSK